jgi:predicted alpha/beta-hydrolase family hydrolase
MDVLFAHGAGLPSTSPWMVAWAERLEAVGAVRRFDYAYMAAGKRRPDRLPVLIEAHTAAMQGLERPLLVGKSMGSRVGCHVAVAAPEAVRGLVCFGYPLCGGGKRDKLRDEVLLSLSTPILFVQGTRDRLCPLDLLDEVRQRMTAPSELYVVEAGDHSLQVTKTWCKHHDATQDDVDARIAAAVARFAEGL